MPAPRKQTDSGDAAFFAALEQGATVVDAARLTGCSRQALYLRRIHDRDFNKRWLTIEAARRRPRRKTSRQLQRPVFDPQGNGGCDYTDGMLLARLKAVRPKRYLSGKSDHVVEGIETSPIRARASQTADFG